MTDADLITTLKAYRKQCFFAAAVLPALVVLGAWGRDVTQAKDPAIGHSVVAMDVSPGLSVADGYAAIRMYKPAAQGSHRGGETIDLTGAQRRRFSIDSGSDDVEQAQGLQDQMLILNRAANQNTYEENNAKNDMFASLKDDGERSPGRPRGMATDGSSGWGWLAEGVQDSEQKEKVLLDAAKLSLPDAASKQDPLSAPFSGFDREDAFGGFGHKEPFAGFGTVDKTPSSGKRSSWLETSTETDTEQKP